MNELCPGCQSAAAICDDDERTIFACDSVLWKDNGELIRSRYCRTIAERDSLLAAARGMVEYIDSPKFGRMSDKQMMSLANLRAAIAKAEGTTN
jgi:hypothetical protein